MHHITSSALAGATSIEVDGTLDVVAAYDLRLRLDVALRQKSHFVGIDLTRVTSVDPDGARGLRRCCEAAVAAGVVLTLTGCSGPFRTDLARLESRRSPVGSRRG
ncbi:STAS domain-containing protein [Nocardioides glacieisoli]|uniref:STAS domain-containing protein n=1 Tax=Nocardioides glacieisoli TaxID=1168730 RepID=A0A4Q2RN54_9ACTN|nr:STAS domain-containing protein [Nocardioides glacieisoli]RYB90207.1 STAS domain-containing protein [Nocardioides glacieisoli]